MFLRVRGTLALILLAMAGPALAAPSCLTQPPIAHPSLAVLPDAYWRDLPAWRSLAPHEADLLARVSIDQRNRRARQGRVFQHRPPEALAEVPHSGGVRLVTDGAEPLARLMRDARRHLASADPKAHALFGSGYRSFEEQLEEWPVNLKRYFERHRQDLAPHLKDGRYTDEGVCFLRNLTGKLYGFPGYSLHQSGRAIDFKIRLADGRFLNASTEASAKETWCRTALFLWLRDHAHEYGFVQEDIDEPWHWVFDPAQARNPARAALIAPSCRAPHSEGSRAPQAMKGGLR